VDPKIKIQLLDRAGKPFDEVRIAKPAILSAGPEAILFADRIFLPTKKAETFRECAFVSVLLPPKRGFNG
jgi:hypothetical protein